MTFSKLWSVSLFLCCNSFCSIYKFVSASSFASVIKSMAEMSTSLSYAEVELILVAWGTQLKSLTLTALDLE